MTYWKWIEDLAETGVPVRVGNRESGWFVEIGGHTRAEGKPSAREAISEAILNMTKAGAKAVAELERTRRGLGAMHQALKEAA